MKLKIDDREKKLIQLVQAFKAMYGFKFEIIIEKLPIGDVILCEDDDTERLIIERNLGFWNIDINSITGQS